MILLTAILVIACISNLSECTSRPRAQSLVRWNDIIPGFALKHHPLQRFVGEKAVELCGIRCLSNAKCLSFNVYPDQHSCELSTSDRHSSPQHVTRDRQARYHGLTAHYSPSCIVPSGRSTVEVCELADKMTDGYWGEWSEWGRWSDANVTREVRHSSRRCRGPFHGGAACQGDTERSQFRGLSRVLPVGGAEKDNTHHVPTAYERIYDGGLDTDFAQQQCYHSATPRNSWVEAHLDALYDIQTVSFLNRGDCPDYCVRRSIGMRVKVCVGAGAGDCQLCGIVDTGPRGEWIPTECPNLLRGDNVRFEHPNQYIQICEVHITALVLSSP